MRDITSIELQKTTHRTLKSIGGMGDSFDEVINLLIKDYNEVNKFIKDYIEKADGKCINDVILGRKVIANHFFCIEDGKCKKCRLQGPVTLRQNDIVINNEVGHR